MMNEREIWKPVVGWEGLYEVSNLGRVKGLPKKTTFGKRTKIYPERILKQHVGKRGYYIVSLNHNYKQKTATVHRLVAQAFIPNPHNKPFIDHIDTNRLNNFVYVNEDGSVDLEKSNLHWCTAKENSNNPITLKKLNPNGNINKRNKNENKRRYHFGKVAQISKEGKIIHIFNSIREAGEALGIDTSSITCVCYNRNKKRHTAGGFKWKHLTDDELC